MKRSFPHPPKKTTEKSFSSGFEDENAADGEKVWFTSGHTGVTSGDRIFGDDFYIELQDHGIVEEKQIIPDLIKLAKEHEIVVMTTDKTLYAACGVLYSNGLAESREAQR